jgi:hypothetical protein
MHSAWLTLPGVVGPDADHARYISYPFDCATKLPDYHATPNHSAHMGSNCRLLLASGLGYEFSDANLQT